MLSLHLSHRYYTGSLCQYGKNYNKIRSKIPNTFLFRFSNQMLVFRAVIHKLVVTIANREDPEKQSDPVLCCLSWLFWQRSSVCYFRT